MKFLVTLAWLGTAAVLTAAPRFAVVRITDIYRELPSTAALQKKIQEQRAAINSDKRAEEFRKAISELQALQAQLEAKKDQIESDEGRKMIRAYEIKRQESETLRQELEEYNDIESKRINKEMVAGMRASLNRITEAASRLAKEQNLDGVFDTSGNSNTGLPFVLYHADAPDLTDDVLELFGENALEKAVVADPKAVEGGAAAETTEQN